VVYVVFVVASRKSGPFLWPPRTFSKVWHLSLPLSFPQGCRYRLATLREKGSGRCPKRSFLIHLHCVCKSLLPTTSEITSSLQVPSWRARESETRARPVRRGAQGGVGYEEYINPGLKLFQNYTFRLMIHTRRPPEGRIIMGVCEVHTQVASCLVRDRTEQARLGCRRVSCCNAREW
jgi:hypothetical protein